MKDKQIELIEKIRNLNARISKLNIVENINYKNYPAIFDSFPTEIETLYILMSNAKHVIKFISNNDICINLITNISLMIGHLDKFNNIKFNENSANEYLNEYQTLAIEITNLYYIYNYYYDNIRKISQIVKSETLQGLYNNYNGLYEETSEKLKVLIENLNRAENLDEKLTKAEIEFPNLIEDIQKSKVSTINDFEISLQNFQTNLRTEIDKAKEELQRIQDDTDKRHIEADEKVKQAETLYKSVFEKTVSTEVSKFTSSLTEEIKWLKYKIYFWNTLLVFVVGLGLWGIWELFNYYKSEIVVLDYYNYNMISLKITFFVLYFTVLNILNKNIKALKHNLTLNKQRKINLETISGFVMSADNKDSKDLMLTKLADAAFGIQSTGYIDNEKDSKSDAGISDLINLLKNRGH